MLMNMYIVKHTSNVYTSNVSHDIYPSHDIEQNNNNKYIMYSLIRRI